MRLFLAVDVDERVRAFAARLRAHLTTAYGPVVAEGLRWVPPPQLHLTMRFFGEVSDVVGAGLARACEEVIDLAPFTLGFGGLSWLPGPARPRVLMVPVVGGAEPLRALKALLDARLPDTAPADDSRPWLPHLTLARVRDQWQARLRAVACTVAAPSPVPSCRVDSAVLYESHLGPHGPSYEARARAPLRETSHP